jgi:uncharacterized membrane-anchored protein
MPGAARALTHLSRVMPAAPLLPPDHPDRAMLAAEVHARPPEPLSAPSRASYVAVRIEDEARDAERAHIATLCAHHGLTPPSDSATQWAANLGPLRLKWERHGEFSSYTFFAGGLGPAPFAEPAAAGLPAGWLASVPGLTLFAAHAELAAALAGAPAPTSADALSRHFGANVVMGATIGEGTGLAFTDFMTHADGFARFLLLDREMSARQAGRMLQRLFEIEAYRMMALLALPMARGLWTRLQAIERTLAELTERLAHNRQLDGADDALLQQLMALAAEVESALAASQVRFGASRAYHALVTTRIAELREQRIQGLQTIEEFMTRRLSPAMATCATVSQRLHDLSERVAQASSLLSTRVDIARQQQNQALLAATARRAKLQLRLQQTVEGLSMAAIVYYLTGLVGYGAKAAKALGLHLSPDLVTGAAVPLLAIVAWWVLRGVHQRIAKAEARDDSHSF